MSKKRRKAKTKDPKFSARAAPSLGSDGLHAFVSGSAPSPETLAEMTRFYQQNIRQSPLWDEMVREFGEQEAERLLREFRVDIRRAPPCYTAG